MVDVILYKPLLYGLVFIHDKPLGLRPLVYYLSYQTPCDTYIIQSTGTMEYWDNGAPRRWCMPTVGERTPCPLPTFGGLLHLFLSLHRSVLASFPAVERAEQGYTGLAIASLARSRTAGTCPC